VFSPCSSQGKAFFFCCHVPDAKIGCTFSQLVRADPSDKAALAGLVTAYSRYDLEKAELYAQQLPAVDGMSRADWNSLLAFAWSGDTGARLLCD
jgi:hypothetical protein